ncbi:MAG: hypothetical protein JXQ65_02640 [Candidatus Marinimicrobia bacterium]|nr:hypothetical protein [Candidatus Neomarinimicrobiota bacterium]
MKNVKLMIVVFGIYSVIFAQQSVEEMMKQMQEQVNQEIQKNEEAVRKFISKNDSLFAEFLKNEWKPFNAEEGKKPEEPPKPQEIPKIPEAKIEIDEFVPVDIDLPESELIDTRIAPEITPPEVVIPPEVVKEYAGTTITFYGQELKFKYNKETKISVEKPVNDKSIPKYWDNISRINTNPMLEQIEEYSQKLALNDYGKLVLIKSIASEILDDEESRILFTWYLITKLGYDVRVGYGPGFAALMVPSNNMLFSRPFLTIYNQRYFIFNFDDSQKRKFSQLYTYDKNHPAAKKHFDFAITSLPQIGGYNAQKELSFKYQGQKYALNCDYNEELVKYFNFYPQTDYSIYFAAPVAPTTKLTIGKAFKPILEGKSEQEALNILLRFVQTAFLYKTDDDQFGREKPLIPDETIYYQYSDCEDRSVLFSNLVEELLGLKVVGVKYEGHMATAVKTNSHPKGDYIGHNGTKYLVCDPTYINANIGMSMPKYKDQNITVIDF